MKKSTRKGFKSFIGYCLFSMVVSPVVYMFSQSAEFAIIIGIVGVAAGIKEFIMEKNWQQREEQRKK